MYALPLKCDWVPWHDELTPVQALTFRHAFPAMDKGSSTFGPMLARSSKFSWCKQMDRILTPLHGAGRDHRSGAKRRWQRCVCGYTQRSLTSHSSSTATETELIPTTPQLTAISAPAAGSLAQLTGIALSFVSGVQLGQQAAPVFSLSDTAIVFQIPWNAVSSDLVSVRAINKTSASPFEAALSIQVPPLYPRFLPFGPLSPLPSLALHQDFGSLVTADQPALPGEIVHLYGTGFGPVTGATQTGAAAPVSGPLQAQLPIYLQV